ncbi:TetR family transcriptional regulator [Flavobacteriaceae bacterium Ap0902]|nr:TetR family transcriptional regulator [Flavobacteriaceae bacterium Ap0902]
MARITDENKMKVVKQTLLDIIVRDGSSNASIAKMAKEAGVSAGYLYRHYDSKESLLQALYLEKFDLIHSILLKSIQSNPTLEGFLNHFFAEIVELTKVNENEVLFLLKMMTDYSIKLTSDMKGQLSQAVKTFKETYSKELDSNINAEQIFTQTLGSILLFINMRKRAVFTSSYISKQDIQTYTKMILKALQ